MPRRTKNFPFFSFLSGKNQSLPKIDEDEAIKRTHEMKMIAITKSVEEVFRQEHLRRDEDDSFLFFFRTWFSSSLSSSGFIRITS